MAQHRLANAATLWSKPLVAAEVVSLPDVECVSLARMESAAIFDASLRQTGLAIAMAVLSRRSGPERENFGDCSPLVALPECGAVKEAFDRGDAHR
ncbi:hypothetical protein K9F62_05490 [Desulfovibrio sp. JY]|nr:hypothetical protein K9F62_05490 [Desulfovibrio sp. JY]